MGFLFRFYQIQIKPITSQHKSVKYWREAWKFLVLSFLFFFIASFLDVTKFLNINYFIEYQTLHQFIELVFLIFLGIGFNLLSRKFT
jgi:polyferredoxin